MYDGCVWSNSSTLSAFGLTLVVFEPVATGVMHEGGGDKEIERCLLVCCGIDDGVVGGEVIE